MRYFLCTVYLKRVFTCTECEEILHKNTLFFMFNKDYRKVFLKDRNHTNRIFTIKNNISAYSDTCIISEEYKGLQYQYTLISPPDLDTEMLEKLRVYGTIKCS